MKAGDLLTYDFRQSSVPPPGRGDKLVKEIRCVQWNIERGYKLDKVIENLKDQDADIMCLQELDINCERSSKRNCAQELAQALKLKCVFFVEFEELHSPMRSLALQGGGVHGNAILSRFDFKAQILPHSHHPVDWNIDGERFNEPRRGARAILAADIQIPGLVSPIRCYSLHFEVFCGLVGRLRQFADVLDQVWKTCEKQPYQLVFGDLNTMAHGIARFSRHYCRDSMRWKSIGYSEASWWIKNVLSVTQYGDANPRLLNFVSSSTSMMLSENDAQRLVNPYLFDPFDPLFDMTLHSHRGWYQGKLDWTLLRGFEVLDAFMDNEDYSASDHKLLGVVVKPILEKEEQDDVGRVAYDILYMRDRVANRSILWFIVISGILLFAIQQLFVDDKSQPNDIYIHSHRSIYNNNTRKIDRSNNDNRER